MARRSETERLWCSRLKQAQERSPITQAELARELSLRLKVRWRQSRVWKLLRAEMPVSVLVFETTAAILGMSMEDLTCPKRDGENSASLHLSDGEAEMIRFLRMVGGSDHMIHLVQDTREFFDTRDLRKENGKRSRSA